ncbi:hypothetical protein B0H13DRAFT_2545567 [Mycena leptocephala]|nr:hypothetical protein B0H13DRAFT_2545567 [Mycena leptocephala]
MNMRPSDEYGAVISGTQRSGAPENTGAWEALSIWDTDEAMEPRNPVCLHGLRTSTAVSRDKIRMINLLGVTGQRENRFKNEENIVGGGEENSPRAHWDAARAQSVVEVIRGIITRQAEVGGGLRLRAKPRGLLSSLTTDAVILSNALVFATTEMRLNSLASRETGAIHYLYLLRVPCRLSPLAPHVVTPISRLICSASFVYIVRYAPRVSLPYALRSPVVPSPASPGSPNDLENTHYYRSRSRRSPPAFLIVHELRAHLPPCYAYTTSRLAAVKPAPSPNATRLHPGSISCCTRVVTFIPKPHPFCADANLCLVAPAAWQSAMLIGFCAGGCAYLPCFFPAPPPVPWPNYFRASHRRTSVYRTPPADSIILARLLMAHPNHMFAWFLSANPNVVNVVSADSQFAVILDSTRGSHFPESNIKNIGRGMLHLTFSRR